MSRTSIGDTLRSSVRDRAGGCCEYCLLSDQFQVAAPFQCDHCTPESLGGATDGSNLAFTCPRCNLKKGKRMDAVDPVSGTLATIFNPRNDPWDHHFVWSSDYLRIEGRTPTGRATAELLGFNIARRVAMRAEFRRLGLHPPHG